MEINREITIEELKKLDESSYQFLDIRNAIEKSYGVLPNSISCDTNEVYDVDYSKHGDKKIIICCAHGRVSEEIADALYDKGVDAYSLKGGYSAWLLDYIKSREKEETREKIETSIRKKFHKEIFSKFTKAIKTYQLIQEGDRVAVCISGGKDSMLMAKLFQELLRHRQVSFEVRFLVMDPGYSVENRSIIEENADKMGIPIEIKQSDIFDAVLNIEHSPCYICARMRRGYLYSFAKELGCNKIALGHHFDDVIETILMGMLYGAQIQTMMPRLKSTNFEGMELIRPMYLIREDSIKRWRDYNGLSFIRCACKFTNTCSVDELNIDNEETRSKRLEIKRLIATLKETNPYVESNIFRSVENISLNQIIAYKKNGEQHTFLEDFE